MSGHLGNLGWGRLMTEWVSQSGVGDLGFAPLPTTHSLRNRALVTHILTYHRITTLPFWPKIHIWRELSFNMLALPAKRILDPSQNLPFLPLCCYCCCSTKITPRPKSATQIKPDIVFHFQCNEFWIKAAPVPFSKSFVSMKLVLLSFGALLLLGADKWHKVVSQT